jgi:hypothetical protein
MHWLPLAALLLVASPAEPLPNSSEILLQEHVLSNGQVSKELAQQTGWSVLRGLRWRILLFDPAQDEPAPTSPRTVFQAQQRFQLEIEAHVCDVWIYLLNVDPRGELTVLFPEQAEEHCLVSKGKKVVFPPRGGRLRFTGPPGKELLRVIASPKKLSWINPKELLEMGQGQKLSRPDEQIAANQKSQRTKSISNIRQAQSQLPVETKSLPELVDRIKNNPQLRVQYKNVGLVPPPGSQSPDSQEDPADEILVATEAAGNLNPIVVDVQLEHR